MIKPQSIRKGVSIYLNGNLAEKQEVIELSKTWSEKQELMFRKTLKQGGEMKINNILIKVIPQDKVVTSTGYKDSGKIIYPSVDMRF